MKKILIAIGAVLVLCIAVIVAIVAIKPGNSKNKEDLTQTTSAPLIETEVTSSAKETSATPETTAEETTSSDTEEEIHITIKDNDQIEITKEGTYILSGTATDAFVTVNVDKENGKVKLILDNLNVTNTSFPVIYVTSADKVTVSTADNSVNFLSVTGDFVADGDTNTDGVIYSKDDLTLNGSGTLNIDSSYNGIVCKDDLKIKGGIVNINCVKDALESRQTVDISGGEINIKTEKDGINCTADDFECEIYITDGILNINAGKQGIQADALVKIDGGSFSITANEGIEATYVLINGGELDIYAYDDGINATASSSAYEVAIEINGGTVNVEAGPGDTDCFDANGCIYINGGTVYATGQSTFDYDLRGELNGGTVYVNGQQVTTLPQAMMGGRGGMGGGPGGGMGGGFMPGMPFGR